MLNRDRERERERKIVLKYDHQIAGQPTDQAKQFK